MYFLAIYRKIVLVFMNRYRPELHYMRGPGPKWFERHGASSLQASGRIGRDHKRPRTESRPAAALNRKPRRA